MPNACDNVVITITGPRAPGGSFSREGSNTSTGIVSLRWLQWVEQQTWCETQLRNAVVCGIARVPRIPMSACSPLCTQVRTSHCQDLIRPSLCKWEWDYRAGQHAVCCRLLETGMEVTAKSLPTPRLSLKCPWEIEMKMESLHTLSSFGETAQLSFLVIILLTLCWDFRRDVLTHLRLPFA